MVAIESGARKPKGNGYLILAVPFAVVGLLVLLMALTEYACSDPAPKQCLLEEDKLEVLLVGLGTFFALAGTAVCAVAARFRPEHRPVLRPVLLATAMIAIGALLYFSVVFFAASIRATT
jgi:hypothetical protein